MKIADLLEEIGFTKYEAMIYATLVSHGPTGVTDINRLSGIPRNKVYETMDTLAKRGIVYVQPGRPVIFKAVTPRMVLGQFIEDYIRIAKEAMNILLREEDSCQEDKIEDVWVISGSQSIKKRLAEMIAEAKKSFFAIEIYPPEFLYGVSSVLKAAAERGVKIRAVSVVDISEKKQIPLLKRNNLIEFRTLQKSELNNPQNQYEREGLALFRQFTSSGAPGGSFIVDDIRVLDIIRNEHDRNRITGILSKVPIIPAFQRLNSERFLDTFYRQI